jgi:CDP-glucose 4,6-dehydratase
MDNVQINKNFWRDKKIFVTGHTGFKGSWLCLILNQLNCKIAGYSLAPTKKQKLFNIFKIRKLLKKNYFLDIRDKKKLFNAIRKNRPEIIFHLASQSLVLESYKNPYLNFSTNLIGTVNILEAAKKFSFIKSLVFVTSDKCYTNLNKKKYIESDKIQGNKDPYSCSKACAELIVDSYNKSFFRNAEISIATVRSGNIIGGGDWSENRLVPDIMNAIKNCNILKIRNPQSTRPWLHILDSLYGYIKIAEKLYYNKKFSGSWNFSPNEKSKNVKTIVDFFKKETKLKVKFIKGKKFKEQKFLNLSSNKSKKILLWQPQYNLIQSLNSTYSWYKNYFNKKNIIEYSKIEIKNYFKI